MTDTNVSDLEKLKDLVITHVAKDVLLLGDSIDKLKQNTEESKALLKQINTESSGYFDNMASKILQLLKEMEDEMRESSKSRVSQISMNVSDNIEQILIVKFKDYQQTIDAALQNFDTVNKQAVESLNKSFIAASETINDFKNVDSDTLSSKCGSPKLVYAQIALQLFTLAALAASVFFLI